MSKQNVHVVRANQEVLVQRLAKIVCTKVRVREQTEISFVFTLQEQAYIQKMMAENRLSTSSGDSGKDSSGEGSRIRICKKRKTRSNESTRAPIKQIRREPRKVSKGSF